MISSTSRVRTRSDIATKELGNALYQIDRARAIADYDRIIALGPDATRDTSVCGHRFLATHNGWHLRTILDIGHARC